MSTFSKIFCFILILKITLPQPNFGADPERGYSGMVVSANNLATSVGVQILKKGGNAVDAAVAVGFALAVTYPYAGNLGGGGFMVIHTSDGRDISIDYREKAPLKAARDMYLDSSGNVIPDASTQGINSSGVPGSVAGLLYALEHYGTMKLADVIQPAINLAEQGFPLDFATASSFGSYMDLFLKYNSSLKVFSRNGEPYREGNIFKQPDLAATLKRIQTEGRDGFYKGRTAEFFLQQVKSLGGLITAEDLESYDPVERKPVTGYYRGYKIVSMAPPSSGGVALIEMLNILENKIFTGNMWNSSIYIQFLVNAMKFAYADRAKFLGDPDFNPIPVELLTSKEYGRQIFSKIKEKALISDSIYSISSSLHESMETTHYSVYDTYGNAVSTTTTINSGYGAGIVVDGAGFLLNNEMDDFSVKPGVANQFGLIGNRVNSIAPGKRMLSSMTPTIILKDNKPFMVLGSPGGSTIITAVLQVIMNVIDFKMNIRDAVNAPRIHHQLFPDQVDYEPFSLSDDVILNLVSKGNKIGDSHRLGLVEAILIDNQNHVIYGATDIRGHGSAEGY